MTDQEQWNGAVETARREFSALSGELKESVRALSAAIQEDKHAIACFAATVGTPELCASCGGRCCEKGKYHFTLVDLLIYFATGTDLFQPDFYSGNCPFLVRGACLMAPVFRPLICITFHCDLVEEQFNPNDLLRLYDLEASLRKHYRTMEGLFGRRLDFGVLLSYSRYVRDGGSGMLSSQAVVT